MVEIYIMSKITRGARQYVFMKHRRHGFVSFKTISLYTILSMSGGYKFAPAGFWTGKAALYSRPFHPSTGFVASGSNFTAESAVVKNASFSSRQDLHSPKHQLFRNQNINDLPLQSNNKQQKQYLWLKRNKDN